MTEALISKVWSFCNTLRDDGVGYGDYLEQLTYLLFLKMADEFSKPPHNRKLPIPNEYKWESLTAKSGAALESHYTTLLRELSHSKAILGQIFIKSQNKIQDPAKLYKLIDMIDKEQWTVMGTDVKGKIYEGLLEKTPKIPKAVLGSILHRVL
jgi:Type I restriction-modification system methyltransferase subunit